jgi:hypothetical protein
MKNLTENKPSYIMMLIESIRLVNINTTSNEEEDFLLLTDLNDQEIKDIITPIVEGERKSEEYYTEEEDCDFYDNEGLVWALKEHYPNNLIIQYTIDSMDSLTI